MRQLSWWRSIALAVVLSAGMFGGLAGTHAFTLAKAPQAHFMAGEGNPPGIP